MMPGPRRLRTLAAALAVAILAGTLSPPGSEPAGAATAPGHGYGSTDPFYDHSQYRYLDPMRVPQAWERTTGSADVTVAIVDSGVDLGNAELKPNLRPGRDIVNNDDFPMDDSGRGTQMAGIIAAPGNDGIGSAGIAWHAGVMPVKVLDARGRGTDANIAAGINWAADHGADIILLALAGQPVGSATRAALDHARDQDALVVAAAGDSGTDTPVEPAADEDVLAVTATDREGRFDWQSNWGSWVDLAAPGWDVSSVWSTSVDFPNLSYGVGFNGTVPAASLVAGVAALARSARPQDDAAAIRRRLTSTARDVGPHGFDPQYGWGLVDALGAVGGPAPAPHVAWQRDERESDDTADTARPLTGDRVTATLTPEGDVDWYAVPVLTPQWVHLTVIGAPGGTPHPGYPQANVADTVVDVYDANFRRLTTGDRTGPGEIESVWVHADPGQLLVSVQSKRGAAGAEYSVTVERAAAPPGPFDAAETYGTNGYPGESVAVADVTGDGRNDVIASTSNDYEPFDGLFVYPGTADGKLGAPTSYRLDLVKPYTNTFGAGLATGDLDGDGKTDVALAGPMGGVLVYLQRNGKLVAPATYGTDRFYRQVAIGDADGDGRTDIAGLWNNQGVDVFRNIGSGFEREVVYNGGNLRFPDIAMADVTGDGRDDIAIFDCGCLSMSVFSRRTNGTYDRQTFTDADRKPYTWESGLELGDATGDGRADLVVLGSQDIFIWPQLPGGGLGAEIYQSKPSQFGKAFRIVDATGDGRNDLVLGGTPALLRGLPLGGFGDPEPYAGGSAGADDPGSVAVGDVDGDGLPDAVVAAGGFRVHRQFNPDPPARESRWLRSAVPAPFSDGASPAVVPVARFARGLNESTVAGAVRLVDGRTLAKVAATVTYEAATGTLAVRPKEPLPAGPYWIEIGTALKDTGGQQPPRPISWRFTVGPFPDHDAPETWITSGPAQPYDAHSSATFTFASDDPSARFECAFDQERFVPCSTPFTVTGLEEWTHVLRVRAADPSDNVDGTPAEYAWEAREAPDWYQPGPGGSGGSGLGGSGGGAGSPSGPGGRVGTTGGYWLLGGDGRVYAFGTAGLHGDLTDGKALRRDVRDLEPTPSGAGYWIVSAAGAVSTFGDAAPFGALAANALRPGEKAASLSATPSGRGYWIFTDRGRVFPFGDATSFGDLAAVKLNGPVLDSIPTATGRGYYMVASDGGIFAFGDAVFRGSMGGSRLNAPVRGLVPDGDGSGYWLVASDGGIFAFDASFRGSLGGIRLNKPVTGMVRYGDGYLMVGEDGGIFNFSSSPFAGSLGNQPPAVPIVSVAARV